MPLSRKDGGDILAPGLLDSCQDSQFVINHDIVLGGISSLYIIKFKLFMNIDQNILFEGFTQSRAVDFSGLENDITIRQYYRQPPLFTVFYGIERIRKKAVGKGVIRQKVRSFQQFWVMWILSTIPLEGTEIISVTEFGPDFLKDFKIVLLSLMPDCLLEVPPEVSGYAIVIEQRVVNIKEEDHFIDCHITNSFPALRSLPKFPSCGRQS